MIQFYSIKIFCNHSVHKFPAELRDPPIGSKGRVVGGHQTNGYGLKEDWQAHVKLAITPGWMGAAQALHPAALLTDLQWPSLSLKSCLETKLQSILPGALGGLVEPECLWLTKANPNVPGWWVSMLVLFKVCQQLRSVRWEALFSYGCFFFSSFFLFSVLFFFFLTRLTRLLLVSKQIFFSLPLSSCLFGRWYCISS